MLTGMIDHVSLILIIFINLVCICAGGYSLYKFISAFMEGKDMTRYQGYMVNGFILLLVLPTIITFAGLKLSGNISNNSGVIGFEVELENSRGVNNIAYFDSTSRELEGAKIFNLNVPNNLRDNTKFEVRIECPDGSFCSKHVDSVSVDETQLFISPKIVFKLPVRLYLGDGDVTESWVGDILILDDSGEIYDKIPLILSELGE